MKSLQQKKTELEAVLDLVRAELHRAWAKHPGQFHSAHEAYAVLAEEVDELWDEVKADRAYDAGGQAEAIQVAAMAVRFVVELHNHPKGNQALQLQLLRPDGGPFTPRDATPVAEASRLRPRESRYYDDPDSRTGPADERATPAELRASRDITEEMFRNGY